VQKSDADKIIIAVPTGHWKAIKHIVPNVEAVYCANLRSVWTFAGTIYRMVRCYRG